MTLNHGILAFICVALWGCNFPISKMGLEEFPPFLFTSMRFLVLMPLLFFYAPPKVPLKYYWGVSLCWGVFQFTSTFMAMKLGASSAFACLVLQTGPFFAALFASMIADEKIRPAQIVGMMIAFGGVAVALSPFNLGTVTFTATLLLVFAAASWGFGNTVFKKANAEDTMAFVVWTCLLPAVVMFGISVYFEGVGAIQEAFINASLKGHLSLFYNGFFALFLGGSLWGSLLKIYPSSRLAAFTLTMPVVSFIAAHLILGESIYPSLWVGAALITAGLIFGDKGCKITRLFYRNP